MIAELNNEQIVTNLLISNEILKPAKQSMLNAYDSNLGDFLESAKFNSKENVSRYSFIDLNINWN